MSSIGSFLRTVRYLRPQQVWARLTMRGRRLYYQSFLFPFLEPELDIPEAFVLSPPLVWKGSKKEGKALLKGNFSFINREIPIKEGMQWFPGGAPALWVYHLHYFEWLRHLRALAAEGRLQARAWVEDWVAQCGTYHKIAWHPYPLSLRIISWVTHGRWLLEEAPDDFRKAFMHSLARQVAFLEKNLEWDVGGNHLIKNLKALIYAGVCLPGKQSVFLDALNLMLEQLAVQILPDGAHYERSPHYHMDVLRDMLDIRALLLKGGHGVPHRLDDVIDRMVTALAFYRYPDGRLGLFNDGEEGNREDIAHLLDYAGRRETPPVLLENAGYARLQRGNTFVMVDAGLCCPDDLPAHAHADTLSFEMLVEGERLFVNCGTYAYQSPHRNELRGTAAHNTVCVDGENSAEVWATFRLGRRPREVSLEVKEAPGVGVGLEAAHDGYRFLRVNHERRLFLAEDGKDFRGEDTLVGRGVHRVEAHFHLHPDVRCKMRSEREAELKTASGKIFRVRVAGGRLYEKESFYAPVFGDMRPSRQLVIAAALKRKESVVLKWSVKKL